MVVPGVTSAIAVPAYAGIPVTDRRHASSIAIITGHESAGKKKGAVDWSGLANAADTLVVLMGMKNLEQIAFPHEPDVIDAVLSTFRDL